MHRQRIVGSPLGPVILPACTARACRFTINSLKWSAIGRVPSKFAAGSQSAKNPAGFGPTALNGGHVAAASAVSGTLNTGTPLRRLGAVHAGGGGVGRKQV